jgi:glycosyltransferase involved in cell wall biosynthesis
MKQLKDCKLTIAGSIPKGVKEEYKEHIQRLADMENIETEIRWISEKEKLKFYDWADIVVLPHVWAPYQSGIMHNAIACGLPVVVTRAGSLHEMVDIFKLGKVVPPKNSKLLAEGIKDVFKGYDGFNKGVKEYQRLANWKKISEEHKELYRKLA